ncbi:MAG: N-6 DNA methylase [Methanothrix sp.]|nr:N-6 DNA methylase [Methanothrix sp.]
MVGIDINKQAVQVAAFSLYLAFLDSLEPKDIRQHKQLPNLIYDTNGTGNGTTLYIANAFWLTAVEKQHLEEKLENPSYDGRAEDMRLINHAPLPLRLHSFDVIIGNPPWGSNSTDATKNATRWCNVFNFPVGYKELSQCFIWRCQSLVRKDGVIGLLVSSGVMLKNEDKSREFRRQWLSKNRINAVYDFSHVRQFFFRKQKAEAIAPFAIVFYGLANTKANERTLRQVLYVSVKRTIFAEQLQAVVIDKTHVHLVNQRDFIARDWLWKAYMWGGVRDAELLEDLKADYLPMRELVIDGGRGFGDLKGAHNTTELGVSLEMLDKYFDKDVSHDRLIIPIIARDIRRVGKPNLYKGHRIIVRRGVARSEYRNGEIQAKLFTNDFAFTDNFIGISVDNLTQQQQRILLGIMQSSLAKYYHFLTCSMWGLWHFKIHTEEHLDFPVAFPEDVGLSDRIISAMMELPFGVSAGPLFEDADWKSRQARLDNAVFDLYELSERQRDLVKDFCDSVLEFFYAGAKSEAVKAPSREELELYRQAFLELWDKRLPSHNKYLETMIYAPSNGLLCGLVFQLKDGHRISSQISSEASDSDREMRDLFQRLSSVLRDQVSRNIYTDRVLKVLTDSAMCIVKRAEKRYWTRSQARQDASELLTEVFSREWQRARG